MSDGLQFSSEERITYSINVPYRYDINHQIVYDDDVRLWILYHIHENTVYHITDNACPKCKKEVPSVESIAMAVRLREFKNPSGHISVADNISKSIKKAADKFERHFLR
jgi:hypothetical protein